MSAAAAGLRVHVPVDRITVSAYTIPTDRQPESDGTAVWSATTLVLVEIQAGGKCGTGWTYQTAAAAKFIEDELIDVVRGANALDTRAIWTKMTGGVRNIGRSGFASYAIAAVASRFGICALGSTTSPCAI